MLKKLMYLIMLLFFMGTGIGYTADQNKTFEWNKAPIEPDLAGFTLYEYDNLDGPATGNTWDIPYAEGEGTFEEEIVITVPDNAQGKRCYTIDCFDTNDNRSEQTTRAEVACFTYDTLAPTVPTEFILKAVVIVE